MKKSAIPGAASRLLGQQLGSVLTAIDYITLKFAKYPLTSTGDFSDGALLAMEEGFEITSNAGKFSIRKNDDLGAFQKSAAHLLGLIGQHVTDVSDLPGGELTVEFDGHTTVRLLVNPDGFDSFELTFKS